MSEQPFFILKLNSGIKPIWSLAVGLLLHYKGGMLPFALGGGKERYTVYLPILSSPDSALSSSGAASSTGLSGPAGLDSINECTIERCTSGM